MACILCDSERHSLYCRKPPYELVRCEGCGFVYVPTTPRQETLTGIYDGQERARTWRPRERPGRRWRFRRLFRWMEGFHAPGEMLDIGCSQGDLLRAARDTGRWNAMGIDLSQPRLAYAASLGLRVAQGTLEEQGFPDGRFDLVTASHVIEHLPDPVGTMREVRRILKPGGVAILLTPCIAHPLARLAGARWSHIKPPNHLWYFAPATFRLLLEKAGLAPRLLSCRSRKTELRAVAEKPA